MCIRDSKQDFLLVGRCVPNGGDYRTEYELFDVAKQQRLLGFALTCLLYTSRCV